ncbi:Josephin domain-containing protein [Meloidogyne graminicola]|uniref:ubiquitinyl hydrolase 1 n=1 Tax=Meloidogyne graminicola TaxID=189291 RepID=A0A8T0A3J5_9BILA|nr:Josephin domain-containing protein [Meloidogyne graminicola]
MKLDNPACSSSENRPIYHEKQRKQLCLLHTLNNLFQRREFSQQELDEICERLDDRRYFNPHRSWIGLGNYDANILLIALQSRDFTGRYFDKRLPAYRIKHKLIRAYIFNIPSPPFTLLPFFKGRHWFAVLSINNVYYNLDSKLDAPIKITEDFNTFIDKLLEAGNELLLVVEPENENTCVINSDE